MMSMIGSIKSSFGQALLTSQKSMQILMLPSFFEIGTMLDIHEAYARVLMKLVQCNLSNSTLTSNAICGCIFLSFCLAGLAPRVILRW